MFIFPAGHQPHFSLARYAVQHSKGQVPHRGARCQKAVSVAAPFLAAAACFCDCFCWPLLLLWLLLRIGASRQYRLMR